MALVDNILKAPFTKIAANGQGDLQRALGSSSLSQTFLMTSVEPNKWAKYQPFVSGVVYTDRYTDANSQRLAGLKAANWGWGMNGIPSYPNFSSLRSALAAGITAGKNWTRTRVTAANVLRAMDFDGYATTARTTQEWGTLGQDGRRLYFPFSGIVTLSANNTTVSAADTVTFNMDALDPDVDGTGLLYLRDFAAMASINSGYYNYAEWYFGLLLVPTANIAAATTFYLLSVPNPLTYFTTGNTPGLRNVPFVVSASKSDIPNGSYRLYPVLTKSILNSAGSYFVQLGTSWSVETAAPGRLIFIDGYGMDITVNNSLPVFNVGFTFSGSAFTFTFRNGRSSDITFVSNMLYAYIQTEHDFDDPSLDTNLTAAKNAWYLGTAPSGDIKSGSYTYARLFNLYSAFYAANGNSNVLAAGKSVSFTVATGSSYNGYPYNDRAGVDVFVRMTINGVTSNEIY